MGDATVPLATFVQWLANGERGLSSEAIVSQLTGAPIGRYSRNDYPHDPADLRRCADMLDAHPLAKMAFPGLMVRVSPEWAALDDEWDGLVQLLREEQAEGTGKAPRTYARMREVIESARAAA